jgi:hypothetical protein
VPLAGISVYVQCSVCAMQCMCSAVYVQCSAVQCSAVQCSAVQCSAVQCSAVQRSAVQCSLPQAEPVHPPGRSPVPRHPALHHGRGRAPQLHLARLSGCTALSNIGVGFFCERKTKLFFYLINANKEIQKIQKCHPNIGMRGVYPDLLLSKIQF